MTAAAPAISERQSHSIPWWKTHWKALVVLALVIAAFVLFRPRGEHARSRAYAVMHRPGVSLTLVDGKLEAAKFELAAGLEGANSNLGWTFQQLARFPEVKSVETAFFLPVNLQTLRSLTELETFTIERQTDIEDDDLEVFRGMKSLKTLAIHGDNLTPKGLRHLEDMPTLSTLKLAGTKLIGAGFENVGRIPNLEHLSIDGGRGEWKEPLSLGSPPKLKTLRLANMNLKSGAAASLNRLQSLEELYLANVAVDAEFFRGLLKLPRLKVLKIRSAGDPFDSYAEVVATLPALESLYLHDAGAAHNSNWVTVRGIEKLSRSKTLEEVALLGLKIGDPGVRLLANLPRLRKLKLFDVGLTEDVLPVFLKIPMLEQISIYEPALNIRPLLRSKPQGEWLKLQEALTKKNVEMTFTVPWFSYW